MRFQFLIFFLLGFAPTYSEGHVKPVNARLGLCSWARHQVSGSLEQSLISQVDSITIDKNNRLGGGNFGSVFVAKGRIAGRSSDLPVIAKRIDKGRPEDIENEVKIANTMYPGSHKVIYHNYDTYIITDYIPFSNNDSTPAMTLLAWAKTKESRTKVYSSFAEKEASGEPNPVSLRKVNTLVRAEVKRMNELGFFHRDIKPDNIILYFDEENQPQVRLIDFGISRPISHSANGSGSLQYMSPKILSGEPTAEVRDEIYSIGMTALATMGVPFDLSRQFPLVGKFGAIKVLPPGNNRNELMTHFTYVKESDSEYEQLLNASVNPEAYKTLYVDLWKRSYNREKENPRSNYTDYYAYEFFMSPDLGPQLLQAIGDKELQRVILTTAADKFDAMKDKNGLITWFGWHPEMRPQIKKFLEDPVFKHDKNLKSLLLELTLEGRFKD